MDKNEQTELRSKVFEFAESLVGQSDGKLRIAFHEEDDCLDKQIEAAHFLKLNEVRLGRDLELYVFMKEIMGLEGMLVKLLEELLLPVRTVRAAYDEGSAYLKAWGHEVFDEEMLTAWDDLF